MLESKIN